jgi:hypothetical protein
MRDNGRRRERRGVESDSERKGGDREGYIEWVVEKE